MQSRRPGQASAPAPANTYGPEARDSLQAESEKASDEHLVHAADYITAKLNARGLPYALMVDFSLKLRGNPTSTLPLGATCCNSGKLSQATTGE